MFHVEHFVYEPIFRPNIIIMDYSIKFIGKNINVIIDRPMGSKHPKFNYIYPINYGYIPNTKSPDGEEIDVYLLGIFKPINKYIGKCIAVIHRLNDDDDKLVVVPKDKYFNDKQIRELTKFQERFFKSKIIRRGSNF